MFYETYVNWNFSVFPLRLSKSTLELSFTALTTVMVIIVKNKLLDKNNPIFDPELVLLKLSLLCQITNVFKITVYTKLTLLQNYQQFQINE